MGIHKRIEDESYILNLFRNMSKQKEVTAWIIQGNKKYEALLCFSMKKGAEPYLKLQKEEHQSKMSGNIEVNFCHGGVIFVFQTRIISCIDNECTIERPKAVFSSFRRSFSRYNFKENEKVMLHFSKTNQKYYLNNICADGLAFEAGEQAFNADMTLSNIIIDLGSNIKIPVDAVVRHCSPSDCDMHVVGIKFHYINPVQKKQLVNYIFCKEYPALKPTCDFTRDQIWELVKKSGAIDKVTGDQAQKRFESEYELMAAIASNPVLACSLAQKKGEELSGISSVLRIYDRTFLGQQLIAEPGSKICDPSNVEIYKAITDFLIYNSLCDYYINYISDDLPYHYELIMNIDEIISDSNKFFFDRLLCFHCNVKDIENNGEPEGYSCEAVFQVEEFIEYCRKNMKSIIAGSYSYDNLVQFELNEISQVYQAIGLNMSRRIWKVLKKGTTVAFAVAEEYPQSFDIINHANTCRIYFSQGVSNIENIIKSLLPDLKDFYTRTGKESFYLMFKAWEKVAKDIFIPGLTYRSLLGRIVMNKEGLAEFKKLLVDNFIPYTKYYPLTHPQLAIWYTEKVYPCTSFANISTSMQFSGNINYSLLETAINLAIQKNDGIRMRMTEIGEMPRQYVSKYKYSNLELFDFSATDGNAEFKRWCEKTVKAPFELLDSDLFYFALFKINEHTGGFFLKIHHLVTDGWSGIWIINKIIEYYFCLKNGVKVSKRNNPSYIDFILNEEEFNNSKRFLIQKKFWDKKFETVPECISLKPASDIYRDTVTERKSFTLSKELTSKIYIFCEETKNSPFTVFLAALYVYIYKVTSKKDIVVGTPVINRATAREKDTFGMFISMVPVRLNVNPDMDFNSYVNYISKEWMSLLKNQKYPYDLILKDYRERHKVTDNLYDIVISYQNAKIERNEAADNYEMNWHFNGTQTESLQIHVNDRDSEGQFVMDFDYLIDMFNTEEIELIYQCIINILDCAMSCSQKQLTGLDMISRQEKEKILSDFNNTEVYYPKEKTIHQMFKEQVERTPNLIAAEFGKEKLTYSELNKKADNLAGKLRMLGVSSNCIVGILLKRSLEMIVGIMGILKAGGAYLPIDPDYPTDRIRYMLEDSNSTLLLTKTDYIRKGDFKGKIVNLDDNSLYVEDGNKLEKINNSRDLAYVIYTSGSTGKPKGVMIEHYSVINRLNWMQKLYPIGPGDTILQKTPYTFDVSVWELFWWSFQGAKVHFLEPGGEKDPEAIVRSIEENKVTTMHFVPSMLNAFLEYIDGRIDLNRLSCLKQVFASGEALNRSQVKRFNKLLLENFGTKLHNLYGPTEATVDVSYFDCSKREELSVVPIGKPIDNIRLYVADKNCKILPVGLPGELLIAGDGLARGYLNRKDLTDEKFIHSDELPGERLYRTGDLVKWMPDGNIEYLGRIDHQVKIRGLRIELGEIESRLLSYEGIKEAVVVAREDNNNGKYLCGYVAANEKLDWEAVKKHILQELPEYMVPSYFVQLDRIPLSSNGKADRKALPQPSGNITSSVDYIPPRNKTEKVLSCIWSEVLGIERIGVSDSFFELGGDSLKAITLVSKIHKELDKEISVSQVFQEPTIEKMAMHFSGENEKSFTSISKVPEMDYYPASKAQIRMYLLNDMDKNSISYNMPCVLEFDGCINAGRLEAALQGLLDRHEALRTTFHVHKCEIVQKIHPSFKFVLKQHEISKSELNNFEKDYIKPFNLERLPLFRADFVKAENGKQLLYLDMHHIISDGVSLGILLKELAELYKGAQLSIPQCRYRDFSEWQNKMLKSDEIKDAERYWLKTFEGEIPVLNMPGDYKRPAVQNFMGSRYEFKAEKTMTEKLEQLAEANGVTMYMLLLAGFNVMLSRYTSQEDIVIGSPVAGRDHAELENVVGMFVNTLPMRNKPCGEKNFLEFLKEVKENSLMVFENRRYQFEELVNKLAIPRDMGRNPLFDVMFVMQNTNMMQDIEIEGCLSRPRGLEFNVAKFDITLQAMKNNDSLEFDIEYATSLYKRETIIRMAGHYLNILSDIAESPYKKLHQIEMMSKEEKDMVLYEFNDTAADYPKDKTVHQLFEEQASKTPDNIAVVCGEKSITYRELNERANSLAFLLREKGVKADSVVALISDRSIEMVIGIVAILKAGGAYLPINPTYPKERINYMLQDSKACIVLADKNNISKYQNNNVLNIDYSNYFSINGTDFCEQQTSNNLAYIIYTSGSTGKPKGVMIEHKSLVNFLFSFNDAFKNKLESKDECLSLTNVAFDVNVCEIFFPLVFGGSLVLYQGSDYLEISKLSEIMLEKEISFTYIPPTLLSTVFEQLRKSGRKIKLNKLLVGVEPIKDYVLSRFRELNKKIEIINGYGPTETTICSTFFKFNSCISNQGRNVPIGKPLKNTRIYIVDRYLNMLPIGVPGEICISGRGVSRGYLNNPELTNEKFVSDICIYGERMYRTGDLARWLPDGNIEFLGRIDSQVKIRGYRIEMGEIEKCIVEKVPVEKVVVIDKIDNNEQKYLCAYYISSDSEELGIREIRRRLTEALPEYMIPSYFMRVDDIPLTPNGKVDRKSLPEPCQYLYTGADYVEPTNEVEFKLTDLYKEVLVVNRVGINDNFFELGGDSLQAMRVIAGAFQFGWNLNMQDFYKYKTIKELADKISGETNSFTQSINNTKHADRLLNAQVNTKRNPSEYKDVKMEQVLLTGATGFLGAHILEELLIDINTKVYCLVRGENHYDAERKLKDTLQFYFSDKYDQVINKRIFVVNGDITKARFGLTEEKYMELGTLIDFSIHTAALVKHYGDYKEFRKINVKGTEEILSFCKRFNLGLAYVSTISVSGNGTSGNYIKSEFTENDFYIGQNYMDNVYIRSKFEAEEKVLKACENGIDAYIFRVGNLTGRYSDGHFQKNIEENNFYILLKSIINMRVIADELIDMEIDFTPIDLCSRAIVKFLRAGTERQSVFHIYNHNKITLGELTKKLSLSNINIEFVDYKTYIDSLIKIAKKNDEREIIYGVVNNLITTDGSQRGREVIIKSEITVEHLKKYDFNWFEIDDQYIKKLVDYIIRIGFI